MAEKRTCSGCSTVAPETNTHFTLITSGYGWKLSRKLVDGKFVIEWKCPDCASAPHSKAL